MKKKYIWRGIKIEKDLNIFLNFLKNTPNIIVKKFNKEDFSNSEIINDYSKLSNLFKKEQINFDYIVEHATNYGKNYCFIEFNEFSLDENFVKLLVIIITNSHNMVRKMNIEGFYGKFPTEKVDALVNSLVYKWSVQTNLSIIDIFSEFVYRITNSHSFNNGNKRTALVSLVLLMKKCGLYLKETNKSPINFLYFWEDFMIKISDSHFSETEAKEYIVEILKDYVSISYTYYNI